MGAWPGRAQLMRISTEEKLHTWLLLKYRLERLRNFWADEEVFRKKKSCVPGFC
jgi:hypothetical protein